MRGPRARRSGRSVPLGAAAEPRGDRAGGGGRGPAGFGRPQREGTRPGRRPERRRCARGRAALRELPGRCTWERGRGGALACRRLWPLGARVDGSIFVAERASYLFA